MDGTLQFHYNLVPVHLQFHYNSVDGHPHFNRLFEWMVQSWFAVTRRLIA
jgi:hypothetical protein